MFCDVVAYDQKKCFKTMELPDHIFRHEALDTVTLNYLIDKKNFMFQNGIFTYGVHAADEIPSQFSVFEDGEFNWISNTDESSDPGKHWVCVLVEKKSINHRGEINLECIKNKIIILDSWCVNSDQTCRKIIDNITDTYHSDLYHHVKAFDSTNAVCKCSMTIEFPVKFIIQYSSYENCGWFALYFATMNIEEIGIWEKSYLNSYGQITNNYQNTINYFRIIFFKQIKDNPCSNFTLYKSHICKLQEKKNISCNQCCCNYNNGKC